MAHIIESLIFAFLLLFPGAGSVLASNVVINEFLPHPSSGNDWIEIYNPTSSIVDLSNWILVDSTSTMKTLSGSVAANGFISFEVSNRLNNGGDSIFLKDSSGTTIDNYSYSSDPGIDKSIGRSPDGSGWTTLTAQSRDSSNGSSSTSTPSPSPSPTPSPSSSTSTPSSFIISNTPSEINSNQSFNLTITLSLPDNPNTSFYLKGAFKKFDSSNYFGLTKVSNAWVKNGSSYSSQYQITTDSSGNWSGNLEVMPDAEDSGFTGSGDYIFKVGKYTSSGSGPSWSNEITVKINSTAISNQGSIAGQSPSSSPTRSSSSIVLPISSTVSKASQPSNKKISFQIATIAGAATQSSTPSAFEKSEVKSQKQINFPLFVGIALILSGFSSILYIYLRSKRSL